MMKLLLSVLLVIALASCKREIRPLQIDPPYAARATVKRLSPLQPGVPMPDVRVPLDYEENAYSMAEGKRLFSYFNCVGCHAHGGGGMGPALMDDEWIYGYNPEQIFGTITEGRPNGMPSFAGHIPDHQIWQLVAYVRSMSGLVSKVSAPARNDDMETGFPENSRDDRTPVQTRSKSP